MKKKPSNRIYLAHLPPYSCPIQSHVSSWYYLHLVFAFCYFIWYFMRKLQNIPTFLRKLQNIPTFFSPTILDHFLVECSLRHLKLTSLPQKNNRNFSLLLLLPSHQFLLMFYKCFTNWVLSIEQGWLSKGGNLRWSHEGNLKLSRARVGCCSVASSAARGRQHYLLLIASRQVLSIWSEVFTA